MDQEVKNISADAEKKPEQVAKYTAKDSVFTSLFREPKYLLQLYQALHPEDLDGRQYQKRDNHKCPVRSVL